MSSAAWQPLERHLSGFERIKIGLPGAGGAGRAPATTMRNFASLAGGLSISSPSSAPTCSACLLVEWWPSNWLMTCRLESDV